MVRIFASRLGRLLLGIWVAMLVTSVSGLSLVPVASKNTGHGSSTTSTSSAPAKTGGSTSCVQSAPGVTVENNWAWASPGSWGMPGQQLAYQVLVVNSDIGCSASTFTLSVSAPSGFSVSIPTNAIKLKPSSSGFLWANVTSPNGIADGDYSLTASVVRSGSSTPGVTYTSFYKVYSSDTVAPSLFFPNPWDGASISGHSYYVTVSSNDDHAVMSIDLFIDNVYVTTTNCDDITYNCHLDYTWALRGVSGQHTATFVSNDWMGNSSWMTVTFTVG
jgi:hypothetical protein